MAWRPPYFDLASGLFVPQLEWAPRRVWGLSQYGPVVLSIVGGLFVLIAGAWSLLQQGARDREIAGLQRQLAAKSDEIASLTRDSLAAVTAAPAARQATTAPSRPALPLPRGIEDTGARVSSAGMD